MYIKADSDVNKDDFNNNKLSVVLAHKIATNLQNKILENTDATRVVIHTEPEWVYYIYMKLKNNFILLLILY